MVIHTYYIYKYIYTNTYVLSNMYIIVKVFKSINLLLTFFRYNQLSPALSQYTVPPIEIYILVTRVRLALVHPHFSWLSACYKPICNRWWIGLWCGCRAADAKRDLPGNGPLRSPLIAYFDELGNEWNEWRKAPREILPHSAIAVI